MKRGVLTRHRSNVSISEALGMWKSRPPLNATVLHMTDEEPKKKKGVPPGGYFETSKMSATSFEEERVRGNREKTKILQAARLQKLENGNSLRATIVDEVAKPDA